MEEVSTSKLVSPNEIIRIKTRRNISPIQLGELLVAINQLYDIYLILLYGSVNNRDFESSFIFNKQYENEVLRAFQFSPFRAKIQIENREYETGNLRPETRLALLKSYYRELDFTSASINDLLVYLPNGYRLILLRANINSPGAIDLLGIGKIIEQLKDFILKILKVKQGKDIKEIDKKIKEVELVKLRLENTERLLSICKKYKLEPYKVINLMTSINQNEEKVIEIILNEVVDDIAFEASEE